MAFARARVSLIPAPDDPRIVTGALQSAFGRYRQFLRMSGVEVSTPMYYHGADEAGGYLGEFIIPLAQATRPPLTTVVTAWLGGRAGRTVRLSIGEGQAEARSMAEAESFLRGAQQLLEAAETFNESRS